MSETLGKVRENAEAGRVRVSQHGAQELTDDNIDFEDVIEGVATAVTIEDYPDYHKGPSVLCLQQDAAGNPIHVLWGLAKKNPDIATIITAYRPDPERWTPDLMTRRVR